MTKEDQYFTTFKSSIPSDRGNKNVYNTTPKPFVMYHEKSINISQKHIRCGKSKTEHTISQK